MADRTVTYRFRGDTGNLTSSLKVASQSVKDFGTNLMTLDKRGAEMRQSLGVVGDAAGKLGLAAAGGLAFVTKAAMDWETAWTGVLKTVDGSPAQLEKLEVGLRNLATETGFAHAEVAAVAEAAGQLGISTGGVAKFTETMLDMGVSTNLSSEEAATGLARLRNIMGTTEGEIRNTGSAMVALGNNFATTEGEILAMSLRVAGAGRQAGLTTSDVLGLSTAMSSVGIEAEAGGTAISLTMKRIGKEVETGGGKLDLFARTAGLSVEEFTRAWGEDAAGTLTRFVAGLADAGSMGMSTNAVLRELGVTGIREADALLRLSGNAEGLATALDTANEGFRENNALTEESGKFYATSAQQVRQAWASIKDSAIDAGAAVLPVVSTIADGVAGLADGFGTLPGPVKTATTGMLGVTAILGGGLWFTAKAISGVANMREALSNLGADAGRVGSVLGTLGKAATGVGAALATMAVIEQIGKQFDEAHPGMNRTADALLRMSSVAKGFSAIGLDETFNDLGESIDVVSNNSWTDNFLGFDSGDMRRAKADIAAIDAALASIAQQEGPEAASAAMTSLVDQGYLTRQQYERLGPLLSAYDDTLAGVARSTGETAGATDALGGAMDEAAASTKEQAAQLAEARDAAQSTATSFFNLGDSLNDATVSLSGWITDMENQARALREFRENANEAADRGLRDGLIQALREAGPEGALRMQQLADASDAEITRANRAWQRGQAEVRKYTDEVGGVGDAVNGLPGSKNIDITVSGIEQARTAVNGLISSLSSRISLGLGAIGGRGSADGSTVPKDGGSYSDRFPYLLAPGEEVISNRFGQADRHRPLLKAINAGRLADGGTVAARYGYSLDQRRDIVRLDQSIRDLTKNLKATGGEALSPLDRRAALIDLDIARRDRRAAVRAPLREARAAVRDAREGFGLTPGMAAGEVRAEFREFRKGLREAGVEVPKSFGRLQQRAIDVASRFEKVSTTLEANRTALEGQRAAYEDLRSSVAGIFNNDVFGRGGLTNAMLQLEADRNDTGERDELLRRARSLGVTNQAAFELLAARGDLQTLRDLDTVAEALAFQQAVTSRLAQQQAAGAYAADASRGAEIARLERTIASQEGTMRQLTRVMSNLEARVEKGTTNGVVKGFNDQQRKNTAKQKAKGGN